MGRALAIKLREKFHHISLRADNIDDPVGGGTVNDVHKRVNTAHEELAMDKGNANLARGAGRSFWALVVWLFPVLVMALAVGGGLVMATNARLPTVLWTIAVALVIALRMAADRRSVL